MFLLIIHIKKESESEKGGWEAHWGRHPSGLGVGGCFLPGSGPPRRRWEARCVGCSQRDGFQAGELGKAQLTASRGILDTRMPALVTGAGRLLARGPLGWSPSGSLSS